MLCIDYSMNDTQLFNWFQRFLFDALYAKGDDFYQNQLYWFLKTHLFYVYLEIQGAIDRKKIYHKCECIKGRIKELEKKT